MVSANKILTVSYGTFSCTLEGFDDPFSTMRSIAEYFRDLAADDRYFGAEPPQPDAEMLHRIAEREVQRRVEARVEDNGVLLRQADETTAQPGDEAGAPLPAEAPAPTAKTQGSQPLLTSQQPGPNPLDTLAREPEPSLPAEPAEAATAAQTTPRERSDLDNSSIAAKLRRIRAVVGQSVREEQEMPGEPDGLGDDFYAEAGLDDGDGDYEADPAYEAAPQEPSEEDTAATLPQTDSPHEEAPQVGLVAGDTAGEAQNEQIAAEITDQPAKLREEPEDSAAAAVQTIAEAEATGTAQEIAQPAMAGAPVDEEAEPEAPADDEDALMAAILGAAGMSDEAGPQTTETGESDEEAAGEDLDTAESTNIFTEPQAALDLPAETRTPVARVIRVRRAPVEEAQSAPTPNDPDSSLSPEDEADLMAELARVEASDEADRDGVEPFGDAGDAALERIMAETNEKLDSEEASQRRSSIAHLRAAVQVKRADTVIGAQEDLSEEYREDLARVVRPRRPQAQGTTHRLAPLVLVSEQRVDTEDAAEAPAEPARKAAPVRPRRIHPGEDGEDGAQRASEAEERHAAFDAFLAGRPIENTEDMMEAAASFITHVEQQTVFSRPRVMHIVQNFAPQGQIGREDALRAFGKLIREGMITKHRRGEFELSGETRFLPDGSQRASA